MMKNKKQKYKAQKKPNYNVNGFINIIFASIISILIAVIIIIIIK